MTSGGAMRGFHFASAAQWSACLLSGVDARAIKSGIVRPLAPFSSAAARHSSSGAFVPVITRAGDVLWTDRHDVLHRLSPCSDAVETSPAPWRASAAVRVVAAHGGFWVMGKPGSLQLFEDSSLTRLASSEVANLVDIAAWRSGLLALVEKDGVVRALRIDKAGRISHKQPQDAVVLRGVSSAVAFAAMPGADRFVVLAGQKHQQLYWFSSKGGWALISRPVGSLRPCFAAATIAADPNGRVLIAGADGGEFGGRSWVLVLDADGNLIDEVPIDAADLPVTGLAATSDALFIGGALGLVRVSPARVIPDTAGDVTCTIVTPILHSPDRQDQRRWLRVEGLADLPDGTTAEISCAAIEPRDRRDRVAAIASDASMPASRRIAMLLAEPGVWRPVTSFRGGQQAPSLIAEKLFDVRAADVMVCVRLTASVGAALPALSRLSVVYPGRTLMEQLPGIYQREEEQPGSFLRSLVGVLETTTQQLDSTIGSMGSLLDPASASEPWLDFIARWLGVPWDAAFSLEQKRAVLGAAPTLSRARGTRAGLEALLDALVPAGARKRYRVTDPTADFGFATVGGPGCQGSTLPAMLGGYTRWSAALDERAVVGRMRLPCAGQLEDGVWHLAGKLHVEIAATAAERKAWEPWIDRVIADMVPLTSRASVAWVPEQALASHALDGTWTLEGSPLARLGTDAVTSVARLPRRGSRLSASGAGMSTHLA